jgi:hypothetical protein
MPARSQAPASRTSTSTVTYGDNNFYISAHDTEGVKREVMSLLIAGQSMVPGEG